MLEMYLVETGRVAARFASALSGAASRGVAVYVLLDDLGSRGLASEARLRLSASGVRLAYYNPLSARRIRRSLHRDHRKLLLVDGELAYVGGAGLVDSFSKELVGESYWHDVMVELRGPCTADWRRLFEEAWARWAGAPAPATPGPLQQEPGTASGRVTVNMGSRRQEIKRSLVHRFRRAGRRIWLASAYFSPPRRLRRQLKQASRRGVDVRLLLPSNRSDHPVVWYAGRRYYGRLLRHGVRIFEYQPRFMHAKIYLCDDWVSIGSANLDHWTLHWNSEANQEIEDSALCHEVVELFEHNFAQSREISWADWRSRGLAQRLLERLVGWLHAWITRASYREAVRTQIEAERGKRRL